MAGTEAAAFAGIDVTFAKTKRLPIVVCRWRDGRLVPERRAQFPFTPPRGRGNVAACDPEAVAAFAAETVEYLRRVEAALGIRIVRIGIDAPSAPRRDGMSRRAAETALDLAGISCFTTPGEADFQRIREKVRQHLEAGGGHGSLPHANQLWMQVGFALFRELRKVAECVEVYPQATIRQLGAGSTHKTRAGGVELQSAAVARHTGWPNDRPEDPRIEEIAFGPRHDRLDAYLSAWVAALDEADRVAFGTPPDDVIWVPRVTGADDAAPGRGHGSPGNAAPGRARVRPAAVIARPQRPRKCPACPMMFKDFPLGWDAHATHRCTGLAATEPEKRKREYKARFAEFFQ